MSDETEPASAGARRRAKNAEAPPRVRPASRPTPILFALIVITAIATWIIPAGRYELDPRARPSRDLPRGRLRPPSRIIVDSLEAPSTGCTASRTQRPATSTCSTAAMLFGAIDVALFILVIGGFIGITMKTGAIQAGDRAAGARAARSRATG